MNDENRQLKLLPSLQYITPECKMGPSLLANKSIKSRLQGAASLRDRTLPRDRHFETSITYHPFQDELDPFTATCFELI